MLTVLFWNVAKRDVAATVADLVLEHNVDILLLAENAIPVADLLKLLNPLGKVRYHFAPSTLPTKINIFASFPAAFIPSSTDTRRATIRKVQLPGRLEFLLCAVHFQSLMSWSEKDQEFEAIELNRIIRDEESKAGHHRTIVVGDLNMNPFSPAITAATSFNAVMTRQIAGQRTRQLADREHPFFFNPMWSLFGDGIDRPGGTFFHKSPGYESLYWNMLDQVLIRPDLMSYLDVSSLKILHDSRRGPLISKTGRPVVSDHLPILFNVNL